jgi:hypothetical protein
MEPTRGFHHKASLIIRWWFIPSSGLLNSGGMQLILSKTFLHHLEKLLWQTCSRFSPVSSESTCVRLIICPLLAFDRSITSCASCITILLLLLCCKSICIGTAYGSGTILSYSKNCLRYLLKLRVLYLFLKMVSLISS